MSQMTQKDNTAKNVAPLDLMALVLLNNKHFTKKVTLYNNHQSIFHICEVAS